jgi:hypothetical protein
MHVAIGNINTVQINITDRSEACHILVLWDVHILSIKHYLHFVWWAIFGEFEIKCMF